MERKHIVIVDDNHVNLDLAETLLKDTYKVTKLVSGEQLLKFLKRIHPDMILLDVQMPGLDGYQTLQAIKDDPATRMIPVIFITGQKDSSSEQKGFRLGAQDFIGKPFNSDVTLSRIRAQLELYGYRTNLESIIAEKARRIKDLQNVMTISWAEMVESRDGTTGSHVRNTARYYETLLWMLAKTEAFASFFTPELINEYTRASIIHDIGKIGISDQVLKKPGALSKEEFELMKRHSRIGADLIQKIIDRTHMHEFLQYAKDMALYHHERWDGSGYPCGLAGEEIPVFVRAISIADVYDALTSVRPYKRAFTHEEALEIMQEEREQFFCPAIFDVFLAGSETLREILEQKEEE